MKIAKNVLIQSVQIFDGNIEVFVCANVNRENTSLMFSFEPDLNCQEFKSFCKDLGLTQSKTKKLILEQLT